MLLARLAHAAARSRSNVASEAIWIATRSLSASVKSSAPRYPYVDEQADDKDRFKHDAFYNKVVLLGTPTIIAVLIYMAVRGHHLEPHFDQSKYVEYPYLNVRTRPFPWGDGNHTLFHNPKHLFVPGVGFEQPMDGGKDH